jgi:hypothetical protein
MIDFLKGKKIYVLMGFGAVAALAQFALGIDLGIPELKPAATVGELFQQIYVFGVGAAARAAIAK